MDELSVFERRLKASLDAYAGSRRPVDGSAIARAAASRSGKSTSFLAREGGLARRGRWSIPVPTRLAILAAAATILVLGLGFAVGSGLMRLPSVVPPSPSTVVPPSPSHQASTGSGSWTITGKMQYVAVEGQPTVTVTATLLPNGLVLAVGGSSAQLYDPTTGRWTQTGSLHAFHGTGHSATLLADGNVLVAGGDQLGPGHPPQGSAELYDPATGTWTQTGSMTMARSRHSATVLPDGMVLVAGGVTGGVTRRAPKEAELYDPATGSWTSTGSMTAPRWVSSATLLPNGKVLVVGGDIISTQAVQSAELYDPTTGTWVPVRSFGGVGTCRIPTSLMDGKVLVVCAEDNGVRTSGELYDPGAGRWTSIAPLPGGCCVGVAVRLVDGRVLWKGLVDAGVIYDPTSDTWTSAGGPTYPADASWGLPFTGSDRVGGYPADTLTLLRDGRVLMTTLGAGLLYDPNGAR